MISFKVVRVEGKSDLARHVTLEILVSHLKSSVHEALRGVSFHFIEVPRETRQLIRPYLVLRLQIDIKWS